MEQVAVIELYDTPENEPLIRLMCGEQFQNLPALEQVKMFMAASRIALMAAHEVMADNPDERDDIEEMMAFLTIERTDSQLN